MTTTSDVKFAIDLDYEGLMADRDVAKCIKQCLRIYTINRRSTKPSILHFTGIQTNGKIHKTLQKNDGWENWNVQYDFDKNHCDVFPKDKMIYLTCESDNVLETLEPGFVYVIGGLVDHNHHKGLCHDRAIKSELKTARLPLSENVEMKTREVLSTFHGMSLMILVFFII